MQASSMLNWSWLLGRQSQPTPMSEPPIEINTSNKTLRSLDRSISNLNDLNTSIADISKIMLKMTETIKLRTDQTNEYEEYFKNNNIMFKISIITESNFAVLGINGISSFIGQFGEVENEQVFDITEDFIEKLYKMKTHEYGFTAEYKVKFIKLFEEQIGRKCLISSKWLFDYKSQDAQELMQKVAELNKN